MRRRQGPWGCVALVAWSAVSAAAPAGHDYGPNGELCTPSGWCTSVPGSPIASVAADGVAVLVGSHAGVFFLWHEGQWRGGFVDEPGSTARLVASGVSGVDVTTCTTTCRQRTFDRGAFSEAKVVPKPAGSIGHGASLPPWWVRSLKVWRKHSDGTRQAFSPRIVLGDESCHTGLSLFGDASAPVAACRHYTATSIHRFEQDRFVALAEPWATVWAPTPIAVHLGDGCDPCAIGQTVIWRDAEGWRQAPMPPDPGLGKWGQPGGVILEHSVSASPGGVLTLRVADATWRWERGQWHRAEQPSAPSAERAVQIHVLAGELTELHRPRPLAPQRGFATATSLVVVLDFNELWSKRWSAFLPSSTAVVGFSDVAGIAANDDLNVRAGPHAVAAPLGALPATATCVARLDAMVTLGGQRWQAVQLPGGVQGWVNARFLRRASKPCGEQ